MDIHVAKETILVEHEEGNFEFRINENEENIYPIGYNFPTEVLELIENKMTDYDLQTVHNSEKFEDIPIRIPYNGAEAAEVLEFDQHNEKFDTLMSLISYPPEIDVVVKDNGQTYITAIGGTDIDPVKI